MSDQPKEKQTAYERWEMTCFGDERPSVVAKRPPPVELPTQAMVDAIKEEARLAGFEEGHAAGYADAHAAGKVEQARELAHLQAVAERFGAALSSADEIIANDVLELALHLAKGMLKNALEVKPELLLPVVREAIEYLPALHQPALLLLNPADAQLVRDGLGDELEKGGWRVIEDAAIARGGCKVDTATNQIDAQAQARWARLTSALGKNIEWLGP